MCPVVDSLCIGSVDGVVILLSEFSFNVRSRYSSSPFSDSSPLSDSLSSGL